MKYVYALGLALILSALVQNAVAADGREDAHCSAIFIAATEYFQVKADEKYDDINEAFKAARQVDLHRSLSQMFEWERERTNINLDAYLHQVEFYYDKLDTSTALLHYDRCYWRGLDIYRDYAAAQ